MFILIGSCFEISHDSVDRNNVFKLKSHNKATFSPLQYCHLADRGGGGGLYLGGGGGGGGGGLITRCIFLFPGRWAYNREAGVISGWGGGGGGGGL